VYLPKGIRAVQADQDKITALNFSDFNLKYHPSAVDYGPRAVHPVECHKDSPLQKKPGGECMCQVVVVLLPWWLFVAKPPYNS
jgi:hypothetical protein